MLRAGRTDLCRICDKLSLISSHGGNRAQLLNNTDAAVSAFFRRWPELELIFVRMRRDGHPEGGRLWLRPFNGEALEALMESEAERKHKAGGAASEPA